MRQPFLLAVSLALACRSHFPSQPTNTSVAGTWSLQTINGSALPYVASQTGSNKVEITSDVVTAVASGSYTETTQRRITLNGDTTNQFLSDAGSFTLNGNVVILHSNISGSGTTSAGSVSGNTLALAKDGFAYVYKRQ